MYPSYAKWIQSHRDLPLRLNQWNNVVRWEFKQTIPFLRSREFLWQEGHSAHSSLESADAEVLEVLNFYREIYEDMLAVPVIAGLKSENEKFSGAKYTTTIETLIPCSGRAIQCATSHCLGQNFAQMFDIKFQLPTGNSEFAWQNSWGLTTRSLGILTLIHGDNKGLVLPPKIAPIQVVFIPIQIKKHNPNIDSHVADLAKMLRSNHIRVSIDDRNETPGSKFNKWELKGVPIRIEIGPRDLEKSTMVVFRRDTGLKKTISAENFVTQIQDLMTEIQNNLFVRAKGELDSKIKVVETWDNFVPTLNQGCILLCSWCTEKQCEEHIKQQSSIESKEANSTLTSAAKSLCIPFDQNLSGKALNETCIGPNCKNVPIKWTLFGRSY